MDDDEGLTMAGTMTSRADEMMMETRRLDCWAGRGVTKGVDPLLLFRRRAGVRRDAG